MCFAAFWTIIDYCLLTYSLCCKRQIMCWRTLFCLSPIYCLHFANLHCFVTSVLWDKMKIMFNFFVAIQCSVSPVTTYCKLGDKLHLFWTVVCWRVVCSFHLDAALHITDCIDVWCAVFVLMLRCISLIVLMYGAQFSFWCCIADHWSKCIISKYGIALLCIDVWCTVFISMLHGRLWIKVFFIYGVVLLCIGKWCSVCLFTLYYRSWDKVYTVLHGSSMSCYKDQKHAKSVSLLWSLEQFGNESECM